jgi:lipooligosaccharide transport system ATP-binding protein
MLTFNSPKIGTTALVVYDLYKQYGETPVVQEVSFTLNFGEILGLLGPNGAGKTTIVGMLYGGVAPNRGFVQLGSSQVQSDGRTARAKMGIVTQEDNLDPDFSVFENLLYFAHHYHLTGKAARKRVGEHRSIWKNTPENESMNSLGE